MKLPGMGFLSHPRLSGEKIRENLLGESLAGISGGKNVGTPIRLRIIEHRQRFIRSHERRGLAARMIEIDHLFDRFLSYFEEKLS